MKNSEKRSFRLEKNDGKKDSMLESKIKKFVETKSEELIEEIYEEIRKLEAQPWFAEKPTFTTKKQIFLFRVIKALESIVKYAQSFIRLFERHFNVFIDYEVGKIFDKDGKPIVYIKIHRLLLPEEINPELTEYSVIVPETTTIEEIELPPEKIRELIQQRIEQKKEEQQSTELKDKENEKK